MVWQAIVKSVASALFETLVSWFKEWYESEKREAAEWAAKSREHQIESMKEGRALERKMKEELAKPVEVDSIEEWNKKAKERNDGNNVLMPLLFFCLLSLSGCFRFFTAAPEYKPEIPVPPIPELSSNAPISNEDFRKLMVHIEKLHRVIEIYNEEARKSNIENGFEKPPNE